MQPFLQQLLAGQAVEWKPLGEVAKVQRGASPRPISNYITNDLNGVPWIKIGDIAVGDKYVTKTAQRITQEGALKSRVLKKGDFIMSNSMSYGRPYILNIDGAIHDGWASISDFQNYLNSDFLYYFLSSNTVQHYWDSKINSSSVSNLNSDIIKSLQIPIPPLSVQTKIAQILDTFTAITAELTAELNIRNQQYQYYRDKLLSENELAKVGFEWKSLGEVINLKRGKRLVRSELEETGEYAVYQNSLQPLGYYHQANCPSNSTFIITAGAAGEIGYSYTDFWAADDCYYLECPKDKLNDRFVYHALMNQKQKIVGQVRKASVPRLGRNSIENILIPIPPLAEQARIVAILDKFDTLTQSISDGLPREIELRQKQYAYYREMLLGFGNE